MNGFWTLLFLGIVMGGASFLAGLLPLSLSLSPRQLRMITALGTGVLVGTSLIVIIPEGVDTLYKASGASHGHEDRSFSISQRNLHQSSPFPETQHSIKHWKRLATPEDPNDLNGGLRSGPDDGFGAVLPDTPSDAPDDDVAHAGFQAAVDREPHAWIGVSLICGFILMYLIDILPRYTSKTPQPQRFPVSLNQFSFNNSRSTSSEASPTPPDDAAALDPDSNGSRPSSTTVGLVIHAAADGIALGASSTTSSNLSFVIFLALLIHKAPAAFGLTSVLLKQGLSKREARMHLIIFSLAAPIGALLTWSAIHILGISSATLGESANAEFAVGCVLLFSGGTFLYVAMHTMQESGAHSQSHGESHDMEYAGIPRDDPYIVHVPASSPPQTPALVDTLVTVGGMLLPLLTQIGHSH